MRSDAPHVSGIMHAIAPTSERITRSLLAHVRGIAEACEATAIFVYADALEEGAPPLDDGDPTVYYITKTPADEEEQEHRGRAFLRVPDVPLSRMGQLKIAVFLAMSRRLIKRGDIVVCLAGMPASGTLDTVLVIEVGREFEMVTTGGSELPAEIKPEVVERVIDIASELGSEGREGKPVGTLFVVGDSQRVLALSRQLIFNPFRGYPEEQRNILNPELEETIKELSSVDGAFVVRGDGVVETCGAYLKTASQEEHRLPQGLGARHHAAAAITALSDSLAVAVSESTGTVTIFRDGAIVTEIEKLRSLPNRGRLLGQRE